MTNPAAPDPAAGNGQAPSGGSDANTGAAGSGSGSVNTPSGSSSPTPATPTTWRDEVLEQLSGQDPARGRRRAFRAIAVTCAVALVSIVGGFEVSHWLEDRHAQGDAERDDRNADVIEDAKKPFDWKMNPGLGDEQPWTSWVLDRRLTPEEQTELKGLRDDRKAIWAFVKKRGGWRVGMDADSYKLQLTSEKEKAVVVTQLAARAVDCRPSPVKTSISIGTGGTEVWDDAHFRLTADGSSVPALVFKQKDPTDIPEEAPFEKVVSLGGAQSPGFLVLTPFLDVPKLCDWSVSLEYNVNSGKTRSQTIAKDDDGRPLRVTGPHGEGVDSWVWSAGGTWVRSPSAS
ncbi:hypothetical protein [Streptomyces sp. NPDC003077]|uniref:hypothetical protein n=1 Tax=Streptomyces sp. NPDC003077 TaxID=3154443 RepID=UPI0033BA1DFB